MAHMHLTSLWWTNDVAEVGTSSAVGTPGTAHVPEIAVKL